MTRRVFSAWGDTVEPRQEGLATLRPTSRRERNEVVTVTAEFAELANSVGDLLVELDRRGKIDLEREPEAAAFLRYLDKTDL